MGKNLNNILNHKHQDAFQSTDPVLLLYGGAGAGKSFTIADKLLLQSVWQPDRDIKIIVIRKTFPSLRNAVIDIFQSRAKTLGLPFNLNKGEWKAYCLNLTFIFQSLNCAEDFEKLKSMTDIDFIWINELSEVREADFEECDRRLRGGQSRYEQLICDFNPVGKTSWVYKRFFQKNIGNVRKLRFTVLDNHFKFLNSEKGKRYIEKLKAAKEYNYNLYKIYFLGEWGELEGVIYDWDIVEKPDLQFDEVFYGGDFGYSVDPAALVRIYRKADEYWLEEVIYETELTNMQLGRKMIDRKVNGVDYSYWDSAEPKSIQELCNMGINAIPADKGPDSVRAGIDFLKEQRIHIIEGNENIIKEQKSYVWKTDKDGNALNVPIDLNNHAMDAVRYGIYTHCKHSDVAIYTNAMYLKEQKEYA